jgi:TrmH family RNA methyltransferase
MSELVITSKDNSLVKRARAVRDGKIREEIFIEGLRLCEEAAQALSRDDILHVISTERIAELERGARLLKALKGGGKRIAFINESVFSSISDTKTPQGIVLLAARPDTEQSALLKNSNEVPLLVILHKINNPSNAGAILRTVEASGATGVILTEGATDIFSPKALRGSMGSSLRLPLWTGATLLEALVFCKAQGILTVSTDLHARHIYTEIDWTMPRALIVGSEGAGLEKNEIDATQESLKIPMRSPVESLNVAVATAVILYEAARQRAEGRK